MNMVTLNTIKSAPGSKRTSKRLGRGSGSGTGKTAGRGHKGAGSRVGVPQKPYFEGGQTSLIRRIPKRGFRNMFKHEYQIVNIMDIEKVDPQGKDIGNEVLFEHGLIRSKDLPIKILGDGELTKSFVIKAHAGPTFASRLLAAVGLLKVTYIYRDPRDAMLSAFNYGERGMSKGRPNAFSHLTDFDKSLAFISDYLRIWEKWIREKNVLIARYEDLLTNYEAESVRLAEYLGLNRSDPRALEVIEQYRPKEVEGRQGTHFFKGQVGRFREAYSPEQQKVLAERFGDFLPKMGYVV